MNFSNWLEALAEAPNVAGVLGDIWELVSGGFEGSRELGVVRVGEKDVGVELTARRLPGVLVSRHHNYDPAGFAAEGRAREGSVRIDVYLDSELEEIPRGKFVELISFLLDHELHHNRRWVRSRHDERRVGEADYPRLPREWDANIHAIARMFRRLPPGEVKSYDDLIMRIPLGPVRKSYFNSLKWRNLVIKRLNREGVKI